MVKRKSKAVKRAPEISCRGRDALGWLEFAVGRTTFAVPPAFENKIVVTLHALADISRQLLRLFNPPGELTVRVRGVKYPIAFRDWTRAKSKRSRR